MMPAAAAKAMRAATPSTIAAPNCRVPVSGTPKKAGGTRSTASPTTPPSPEGSGQWALRGKHEANAAASTAPRSQNRTRNRSRLSGRCPSSR